jgi:hypothetical protein
MTDWLVTRLHVDLQQQVGEKLLHLPLAVHQREGRATSWPAWATTRCSPRARRSSCSATRSRTRPW